MKRFGILLALSALVCVGSSCEKEKTPEPAAPTPSAAVAPTPAPPVAAPANETIPVTADFEDEAEKTITPANYKSELDSLEKEIK
jgi:hypothetical protein